MTNSLVPLNAVIGGFHCTFPHFHLWQGTTKPVLNYISRKVSSDFLSYLSALTLIAAIEIILNINYVKDLF